MFDCASVDSMKVMTRSILKKVEKAGGKEGVEASPEKAAAGGKKRKGKAGGDGDDAEEKPKKRGRPAKKDVKKAVEGKLFLLVLWWVWLVLTVCAEEDAEDGAGDVKAEEADEF